MSADQMILLCGSLQKEAGRASPAPLALLDEGGWDLDLEMQLRFE